MTIKVFTIFSVMASFIGLRTAALTTARRVTAFQRPLAGVTSGRTSSLIVRSMVAATPPASNKNQDQSAMSRSRAPFQSPKNAKDDSVPDQSQPSDGLAWSQLGVLTELVESVVADMELEKPTPVQQLVIPALLKQTPKDNGLAFLAATGSGKTLAYLLPTLQQLKADEVFDTSFQRRPKRPRLVVLAPTRELATQITSVVKKLCHSVKLSSQCLVGGEDYGKQRKRLDRYVDIIVATPGRLLKHWKDQNVFLGDLQFVVVDEMDTMLEQGFQGDLSSILHPLLYKKKGNVEQDTPRIEGAPRVIMTSATMTQSVQKLVGTYDRNSKVGAKKLYNKPDAPEDGGAAKMKIALPSLQVISAPGLHRAVPRLKQVFVDVGHIDKLSLLVDIVSGSGGSGAAVRKQNMETNALTLVFCNTVASCRAAQHALSEAGIKSLGYHGDLNSNLRAESLKTFRLAGSSDSDLPHVLVCTDLAARGLDVPQVDHVVMFDFPLNSLDYLHRAGRTARGVSGDRTGNGRVTALVAKRDRVLAMGIENAVQKGEPLDGLSSRKSDYMPGRGGGGNSKLNENKKFSANKKSGRGGGGKVRRRGR